MIRPPAPPGRLMPDGLPVPARGHAFRIFEEPIQTELGAVAHPVSNIAQGTNRWFPEAYEYA